MISKDKITEIFCIADDFCKELALIYNAWKGRGLCAVPAFFKYQS